MQTKNLNILYLAYKAKKVKLSADIVCESIRKNEIKLILLANDAAKNTTKKMLDKASFYKVELNNSLSSQQLSDAIGKNCKVVGITDEGFKKLILDKLSKN